MISVHYFIPLSQAPISFPMKVHSLLCDLKLVQFVCLSSHLKLVHSVNEAINLAKHVSFLLAHLFQGLLVRLALLTSPSLATALPFRRIIVS